uniref:Uncharacterized protein n=1 Tax=Knipowitschia caucasica TaxID=637954 RepID=A0AAV2JSB3_KNICA
MIPQMDLSSTLSAEWKAHQSLSQTEGSPQSEAKECLGLEPSNSNSESKAAPRSKAKPPAEPHWDTVENNLPYVTTVVYSEHMLYKKQPELW